MRKIKNFSELNQFRSTECLIVGPAPTMLDFNYKKFKGKIFTIGDAAIRGRKHFKADYWIACNGLFPVPGLKIHTKVLNSFKKVIFIYSKIPIKILGFKNFFKENLKIKFFEYDHIHAPFTQCKKKKICCDYINYNSDNTINGNLKKLFDYEVKSLLGGSVFVQALAIAMILGFQRIFVTGVELPDKIKSYNYFDCAEADLLVSQTYKIYDETILKNNKSFYLKFKLFFKYNFNRVFFIMRNFCYPNTDFFNNQNLLYKSIAILSKLAKKNKISIKCFSGNKRLKNLFS